MFIDEKLQEVQDIIKYFNNKEGNVTQEDFNKLSLLEKIIGENPLLIKFQSICLYNAGYVDEAIKYLEISINKYNQSYELHSTIFEMLRNTDNYEKIFYSLSRMYQLSEDDKAKHNVLELLEQYVLDSNINRNELHEYFELFKANSNCLDYRYYPIDEYNESMIRKDVFKDRDADYSYLVNMYKTVKKMNVSSTERFFFLYEMIRGKQVQDKISIDVKEGDVLAISSACKEANKCNLCIMNLEEDPFHYQLEPNGVRYYKIKYDQNIIIETDQEIVVSHFPRNNIPDKPKLVLQIFIDGLSFDFVNHNGFTELMPNTSKFFESGYINTNCHANGEWTLPSLMSMCTGKYTTKHYVYDTSEPHKGEINNKFVQEYFEEAGYMTGRICPNWRGTPSYGYFKSTNRSIYSPMLERMGGGEVVMETLEHLEAFKDFNNYVWMTIEDLHSIADGIAKGALQDMNVKNFVNEITKDDSEISVFRSYNIRKIEEYKSAIKRVDFYLGILFDYISKNYSEDEYLITFNSDHGQKFIEEDDYMFTRKRTNVPFMMKGRNVIHKNSTELMSNVDIVPTLLSLCGMDYDKQIDGTLIKDFGGEERKYTVTESIFPGQTYKLAINDMEHLYTFETSFNIRRDGLIPVSDYSVQLINHKTQVDECETYTDKVQKYIKITYEHIKEWIAFDN